MVARTFIKFQGYVRWSIRYTCTLALSFMNVKPEFKLAARVTTVTTTRHLTSYKGDKLTECHANTGVTTCSLLFRRLTPQQGPHNVSRLHICTPEYNKHKIIGTEHNLLHKNH